MEKKPSETPSKDTLLEDRARESPVVTPVQKLRRKVVHVTIKILTPIEKCRPTVVPMKAMREEGRDRIDNERIIAS